MSGSVHILTSTIFDNTGTIYGTVAQDISAVDITQGRERIMPRPTSKALDT